ncbi:cyclic nucleotide-binding domain-containing protein [Aureimonas altamirensis]|uniref:Crp/Fnr family transcriptional regulator n=1 Tax=Aureimonas altamirensis TaxID=370622 RepID=UPI00203685B2|nr:cyclic nucleotide-binding domain-containing protein [Aureimonas altamirensis]MCM2503952.1 cyclic nucleotide-binding domain-containing protein [Aureimonas altamirensis]
MSGVASRTPVPCETSCASCDVRALSLCAALRQDDLSAMERVSTVRNLAPDEILVHEGDPARRVYTLTRGMLRLSTILVDGRRQITGFLMPGDFLGLADEETTSATAEAVTNATLCAFARADMERLLHDHPPLQARLMQFTRSALREARDGQIMLGRMAPVEKLSSFLLVMSTRMAARGLPANPVSIPMSRSDIADYLGLTIETVSRSFTKLRNQQLIRLPDAHHVDIVDRRALAAVAGIGQD